MNRRAEIRRTAVETDVCIVLELDKNGTNSISPGKMDMEHFRTHILKYLQFLIILLNKKIIINRSLS